jgi:hypothetical protein
MSIKKIEIETTQCDICKGNRYEHHKTFANINHNLRQLGLDFCAYCHENYKIIEINEINQDEFKNRQIDYLKSNLFAIKNDKIEKIVEVL